MKEEFVHESKETHFSSDNVDVRYCNPCPCVRGKFVQCRYTDTDDTLSEQSAAEEERLAAAAGQPEQNHQSTTVHAAANGSYILTVPEFINLHNVEKNDLGSGLYTNDKYCKVNLRGNVCQDQSVMVTVNALNKLNCNSPQLKYCLDANNAVYAEYTFPKRTPDILIGWIALEMQGVIQRALDEAYPRIQNAVLGLSNTEDAHIHITVEQIKEHKRLYLEVKKSRSTSKHRKHRRDGEENTSAKQICVAKMLDKTQSIICAFDFASAAPRSP